MGYLEDYIEFACTDEAPDMFHLWCGYASISSVVGRRLWLPRPPNFWYPNLYVLLVGAAGCGKSQALGKLKRLLIEAGIEPSGSVETVEGLLRRMAGQPDSKPPVISPYYESMVWPDGQLRATHAMTIIANEFIDFIRNNPVNWTGFLNNIYDEDSYIYHTKNNGSDVLVGPYLCLAGAIPTDVGKKLQEVDIINTGLARRTIMQYGERKFDDPKPRTVWEPNHEAARQRCLARLKRLKTFYGQLTESPEAIEFYDHWYCQHSVTLMKRSTPATHGWLSSKPTQVVKLAMLTCIANRDDKTINEEDYALALSYLSEMETTMNMVFGGVGRNELANVTQQVLRFIETSEEPTSMSVLKNAFYNHLKAGQVDSEMNEILAHLIAIQRVVTLTYYLPSGTQTIYATPATLSAFVGAKKHLPSAAVPSVTTQVAAPAVGPSSSPAESLPSQPSADQTAPQSADGMLDAVPPMAD